MMNENGKSGNEIGYYKLPDYDRLIVFPNFKNKLHKKLTIKLNILREKRQFEINRKEEKKCIPYVNLLTAEIKMVEWLLENKEINDMIDDVVDND